MSEYNRLIQKKKENTQGPALLNGNRTGNGKGLYLGDNRNKIIVQKKENKTGLPDNLKSGIENLSGLSMDDVKVHYRSDKPAQLNAHAYAQGTAIHIAPGQEKHLPHEAWHVAQQKQGRVKPTLQMKGNVRINNDKALEKEADVMGSKTLQMNPGIFKHAKHNAAGEEIPVYQLMSLDDFLKFQGVWDANSVKLLLEESELGDYGHTFEKHLEIEALKMMKRLDDAETDGLPATRFEDDPSAMIAEILNEHAEGIKTWAQGGGNIPRLTKEFDHVKVVSYDQAGGSSKGKFSVHYGKVEVLIFLRRVKSGIAGAPDTFYITTAFPKLIDLGSLAKADRNAAKHEVNKAKKHMGAGRKKHEKKIKKEMQKKLGDELH